MQEDGDWEMLSPVKCLHRPGTLSQISPCRNLGLRAFDLQTRSAKIKMANFVGRWEDTGERENFEEFATAMNLPADMLEKYRATKQTIQYGINGNTWTMNPSSTLFPGKEKVYTFEIGKEVNDTGLDGNPIKFVITVVNDNEISEDLKVKMGDSWKDYKVSRKVDGDTMTTTLSAFGKTMTSTQRKLK
uniref:Uncharacterized protein n=1 Tax=Magallana gigas TaxID=29159 RepID=A0A8W8MQR1_MAGGI|nr:fatty acid-binding protein homolog 5-like isoform X1 [Crassostrea gigas]